MDYLESDGLGHSAVFRTLLLSGSFNRRISDFRCCSVQIPRYAWSFGNAQSVICYTQKGGVKDGIVIFE